MAVIYKSGLSERDICTKCITPAMRPAGWNEMLETREEATFRKGRIIVHGNLATRQRENRAYSILYFKLNMPVAIVEANDNYNGVGNGMQQAIDCAETLQVPFAFPSPE